MPKLDVTKTETREAQEWVETFNLRFPDDRTGIIIAERRERLCLERQLASVRDVLREMAWFHGSVHDEGCPEDDTCGCSKKPFNDSVNGAIRLGEATMEAEIASRNCTCRAGCHFDCTDKCCECPHHKHVGRRPRHLYKNQSFSDVNSTEHSRTCEHCGKCLFIYNTPGGTR
jgi:hypothetical protein